MVNDDNKRVMITLPKNTLQKLDDLRNDYNLSLSQVVQFMIMDYMERKEKR